LLIFDFITAFFISCRHGLLATAGFSRGSEGSGEEMRQLSEPDAGFSSESRVPILRIC